MHDRARRSTEAGPPGLRRWQRTLSAGLGLLLVVVLAAACQSARPVPRLVLEHDALLFHDAFDRPAPASSLTPAFRLGGTAPPGRASVGLSADGLHVGVGPHGPGTWLGYFAATSATFPAEAVIHVRMSRPSNDISQSSRSGISLLAVQTGASRLLDYVLVSSVTSDGQDTWFAGHATGGTAYATTKMLASIASGATTEDVTLQTDGRSRYAVYLGDRLVYSSATLDLGVQPPFRVYLEVQARGTAYQARFQDFWVAGGTSVGVEGLRTGDHVALAPDGHPAVSAIVGADGTARLELPPYEAVGRGTLTVDGPGTRLRFPGFAFAGGDLFAVRD